MFAHARAFDHAQLVLTPYEEAVLALMRKHSLDADYSKASTWLMWCPDQGAAQRIKDFLFPVKDVALAA